MRRRAGALNRYAFDNAVRARRDDVAPRQDELAIVLFGIEHFKSINATATATRWATTCCARSPR